MAVLTGSLRKVVCRAPLLLVAAVVAFVLADPSARLAAALGMSAHPQLAPKEVCMW